jgi:tungstate transport system substrate-binding protein
MISQSVKVFYLTLICLCIYIALPGSIMHAYAAQKGLLMATTTSTDNTGLLDYLMPHFTKATGINIRWVATGTGKGLKLGENCDVDVLFVHAPQAEQAFIDNGFGIDRQQIMYNDFVLIGPVDDPAAIKGKRVTDGLQAIQSSGNVFVSRGDNSGTHKKERSLWKYANLPIPEREPWYRQTGQGMLATTRIAAELNGYTLVDRGTFIKYESVEQGKLSLGIMVEGEAVLLNHYSILRLHPQHCKEVKHKKAKGLSVWLASDAAQQLIGEFRLFGKQLFVPNTSQK